MSNQFLEVDLRLRAPLTDVCSGWTDDERAALSSGNPEALDEGVASLIALWKEGRIEADEVWPAELVT